MKMDIDCIRDILLRVENGNIFIPSTHFYDEEQLKEFSDKELIFKKYSFEKVSYHARLCDEFGFLKASSMSAGMAISDLSAQGHLFLADIRSDNVWSKTKEVSNKIGVASISALKQIALNVASALISNQFK